MDNHSNIKLKSYPKKPREMKELKIYVGKTALRLVVLDTMTNRRPDSVKTIWIDLQQEI